MLRNFKNRTELEKLKMLVREGDTVVVWKLDRISISTKNLLEIAEFFKEKEVNFVSLQDNIDTSSPMGKFFFIIMEALAQLDADIVSDSSKCRRRVN